MNEARDEYKDKQSFHIGTRINAIIFECNIISSDVAEKVVCSNNEDYPCVLLQVHHTMTLVL